MWLNNVAVFLLFHEDETRGGCFSIRKHPKKEGDHELTRSEVVFSYNDRVDEVTSFDFQNILLNFVQTAFHLRGKVLQSAESVAAAPVENPSSMASDRDTDESSRCD